MGKWQLKQLLKAAGASKGLSMLEKILPKVAANGAQPQHSAKGAQLDANGAAVAL